MIAFVGSASMPATKEAAFAFEKETEIHGELHLRSSGSMLSQLILSRRGDLYFPGSSNYMAKAIERKPDGIPQKQKEISKAIPFVWVSAYIDTRETSIFQLTPGNSKKPLFAGRRSKANPLCLE